MPDPPPGGAVLRVEAVGMCHSDIDHLHGIVHTPWGGAYPSIPGHEIVGRIDALTPEAEARWGVKEGQRVAVRESVPLPGGIRVYGHDFGFDERSGLSAGSPTIWNCCRRRWSAPSRGCPGRRAYGLGAARDRRPVGDRRPARRLGGDPRARAPRPGLDRGRPGRRRAEFITGTSADALRLDAARGLGVEEAIDISAADPVERIRDLTGDGVDVVIDAASGSTVTVTQGMQMAKRGGTVVIGGLKDRKPVDGFISDWIPMRRFTCTRVSRATT